MLSVVLFGIGVAYYSFIRLSEAEKGENIDLYNMVPEDCIAVLESNNFNRFFAQMSEVAYADRLDSLRIPGLVNTALREIAAYNLGTEHGLSRGLSYMLVSFHEPVAEMNQVLYFKAGKEERELMRRVLTEKMNMSYEPKVETYRGKDILIFPMGGEDFAATYSGKGFLVVSLHKRLIEQVIDAEKSGRSILDNPSFKRDGNVKSITSDFFMGLSARTASMPFLETGNTECWSDFDYYMNSEVFYLSGSMHAPDSCNSEVLKRVYGVETCYEADSLLIVAGEHEVDSCISSIAVRDTSSLFTECVRGMSKDAAFVMVVDMEKVARNPEQYAAYLPVFVRENVQLFRPFIMSVQLKPVDGKISHIFIFTYKQ